MVDKNNYKQENASFYEDIDHPERTVLMKAFRNALVNGDFNASLKPELQAEGLEPISILPAMTPSDWDKLFVQDKKTGKLYSSSVLPMINEHYTKDSNIIEHFKNWKDINKAFLPVPNVMLVLSNNYGVWGERSLKGFTLQEFHVSPKLRGQGVGTHILKTLTTHADENNLTIELVPTEKGDGRLEEGQEGWVESAIAHRKRLIKFYERFGFKLNPYYYYPYRSDYLTKKPHGINRKAREVFTPKAAKILKSHLEYIRFPNGQFPKGWLTES